MSHTESQQSFQHDSPFQHGAAGEHQNSGFTSHSWSGFGPLCWSGSREGSQDVCGFIRTSEWIKGHFTKCSCCYSQHESEAPEKLLEQPSWGNRLISQWCVRCSSTFCFTNGFWLLPLGLSLNKPPGVWSHLSQTTYLLYQFQLSSKFQKLWRHLTITLVLV